jgi:hypothetical protein
MSAQSASATAGRKNHAFCGRQRSQCPRKAPQATLRQ